jgi:hypothetical protein
VIRSVKIVASGIKIGKEHLNVIAKSNDIVLIEKNEIEIRHIL